MNPFDAVVATVVLSAVVGGWRLGLIARVAAWIGGIGGLYIGVRVLPSVLRRIGSGPPLSRVVLVAGVLLLGAAIGGSIGEVVGHRLRRVVPPGPGRALDSLGGAAIGALGVFISLWLMLPVLGDVPGSVSRVARRSKVLGFVQDVMPPPPDTMRTLRSLVGEDRFPEVFADLRPAPDTGPPPSSIPVAAETLRRVTASTVNVESQGCGGIHEGSGFAVAPDTIVTNAHVVAGGQRIRVRRPDQRLFTAQVVVFDDNRDLAVLRAPGLSQQPLPIASIDPGGQGVIVGYPGGQNTPRPAPAVVRDEAPTRGFDIYDHDRTLRQVLFVAASLRPGDSGAPLFDTRGRVVGVAFAIAPDRPGTAYALSDVELRAVLRAPQRPGVGPCM